MTPDALVSYVGVVNVWPFYAGIGVLLALGLLSFYVD